MSRPILIALALLMASQAAMAQQRPTAGEQLRQIPPAPTPPKAAPSIRIERGTAPLAGGPAGEKVRVSTLHVTGQTLFPESTLIAASGFVPGELDLAGMRALAARISAFYNARGYILAQAYVPAQEVSGGTVKIAAPKGPTRGPAL